MSIIPDYLLLESQCNEKIWRNNTFDKEIECRPLQKLNDVRNSVPENILHELNILQVISEKDDNPDEYIIDTFKKSPLQLKGEGAYNYVFGIKDNPLSDLFVLRLTNPRYNKNILRLKNEILGLRYQALFGKSVEDGGHGCPNIGKVYDFGSYIINNNNNNSIIKVQKPTEINDVSNAGVYGIIENIKGGDLFDRLTEYSYSINEIKTLIKNLLTTLVCLHENGIVHLDIKPENIMLVHTKESTVETRNTDIKLIDFGLCGKINQEFNHVKGTPKYTSRYFLYDIMETDNHKLNYTDDIWSVGVLLMDLLYGIIGLNNNKDKELVNIELFHNSKFSIHPVLEFYCNINKKYGNMPLLEDFFEKIFGINKYGMPRNGLSRPHVYTAKELLTHPWLNEEYGLKRGGKKVKRNKYKKKSSNKKSKQRKKKSKTSIRKTKKNEIIRRTHFDVTD